MLIVEEVCNKVLTSTGIRTYVENKMGIKCAYGNFITILAMTHHSAVLKKAFNLPDTGSEDDLIYYNIFEIMRKNLPQYRFSPPRDGSADKVIYDTKEEVAKWTAAPSYELLSQRVRNSNGLDLLNLQQMYYRLRLMDKVNPNYQEKVFIETSVLNALNI
jgi:phage FluMu protein Com